MKFGLRESDLYYIINILKRFEEVEKAVVFGSRAMGNYKPGSDIDIAVYGNNVRFDIVAAIHSRLEDEGPLPYFIDVIDYTHLSHEELKKHIDREGITIYEKL